MASQNVRVIVEFPAGMRKLSKQQADSLKNLFRTRLANIVDAEVADSLAFLEFENVTPPISGGSLAAKKAGSKKGAKKGSAKKSSKKG